MEKKQAVIRVIIVGGGFAGLKCARELNNHPEIDVLLIDKLNYHQFQPLFYQVATASLEPSNISFPLRKVFHHSENVRIRIAEVLEIKEEKNEILTDIGTFYYDILVLATGTTTNFFGNSSFQNLCYPMKSTFEAIVIMNRVINNFEDALEVPDAESRTKVMSVAIVGGGPTGVELAGALSEMRAKVLPKDYPDLNLRLMQIYLIDPGDKPLSKMSRKSSCDAEKYLTKMGVILKMNSRVKAYDGRVITMDDESTLHVNTVVWAAGVAGNLPSGFKKDTVVHANRLNVNRQNLVTGTKNIYAIGDIAYMVTPKYPEGHPQLASVAGSQGLELAKNLKRLAAGKPMEDFEFADQGTMATIGKRKAVVDLAKPKLYINGWLAWFIWMFLHLMLILGVKNKVQIFVNWVYKYFTSDQSLRLAQRRGGRSANINEIVEREIKAHKESVAEAV